MKYALVLFVLLDIFSAGTETALTKPVACSFFTYENAAKIIGGPAKGVDGDEATADGGRKFTCTFTLASGVDGSRAYFMLMRSGTEDAAKKAFDDIRQSNKNHAGFAEWPGVGDEAIVHADGKHIQFLMVRRGMKTIRLKVNPAAGVSLEDTKAIAVSLASKLK